MILQGGHLVSLPSIASKKITSMDDSVGESWRLWATGSAEFPHRIVVEFERINIFSFNSDVCHLLGLI